jgi:hypothetical protein
MCFVCADCTLGSLVSRMIPGVIVLCDKPWLSERGGGVTKAGRMRRWWWHGCGRLSKMMKVRGSQVGLGQQLA